MPKRYWKWVLLAVVVVAAMVAASILSREDHRQWLQEFVARSDAHPATPVAREEVTHGAFVDGAAQDAYQAASRKLEPLLVEFDKLLDAEDDRSALRGNPEVQALRERWQAALVEIAAGAHSRQLPRDQQAARHFAWRAAVAVELACRFERSQRRAAIALWLDVATMTVDSLLATAEPPNKGLLEGELRALFGAMESGWLTMLSDDDLAVLEQGLAVLERRLQGPPNFEQVFAFGARNALGASTRRSVKDWGDRLEGWNDGFQPNRARIDTVAAAVRALPLLTAGYDAPWSERQQQLEWFGVQSDPEWSHVAAMVERARRAPLAQVRVLQVVVAQLRGQPLTPGRDPFGDGPLAVERRDGSLFVRSKDPAGTIERRVELPK